MTLDEAKKLTNHICRLLKVTEITYPIGRTNKGNLGLKFAANSNDFEIMLDAVPLATKDTLNDENNIELKQLIEKYCYWHVTVTTGNVAELAASIAEAKPSKSKKK